MSEFLRTGRYVGLGLLMGFGAVACGDSQVNHGAVGSPEATSAAAAKKSGITSHMEFFDDGSAVLLYKGALADKYLSDEDKAGYWPRSVIMRCVGAELVSQTLSEGYHDGTAPSIVPNFDGCLDDGRLTKTDFELPPK